MVRSVSKDSTALRFVLVKAVQELSNVITEPRLDKDDLFIYLKKKYHVPFIKAEETLAELIGTGLVVQSADKAKVGINKKWKETDLAQAVMK